MKIQWRKNVLVLVGMGYALTLIVFIVLVFKTSMTVGEAYEIVAGPFMALVGGSLAIAKDLINADDETVRSNGRDEGLDDQANGQQDDDQAGNADEQQGQ